MGGAVQLQQVEFGRGSQILSVVSGLHGDDYNGLGVCLRLIRFFKQVEAQQTPYRLSGRIRLLPAANALALIVAQRNWPVDGTDLNGLFPGYVAGEATQRLAHLIFEATRLSRLCINLESGGELAAWPQVRSCSDHPTLVQTMQAASLPLAWVCKEGRSGSLGMALQQQGVDYLAFAAGQVAQLDLDLAERMTWGVVRLALHLGILHGPQPPGAGYTTQSVREMVRCFTQRSGVWLPAVALGALVQHQQVLGEVVEPITGEILQPVYAPAKGWLAGLRVQPLVTQGSLLARIAQG